MKVFESVANHHMGNVNFYYPTSLTANTANTTNSLPSPPFSFYEKTSQDVTHSFCDGPPYNNTIKKSTETSTAHVSQPLPLPQNYTIDHSSTSKPSSAAPTLSTTYNDDSENRTIRHSPKQYNQEQQQQQKHYQPLLPTTALLSNDLNRYHQASNNVIDLCDNTTFATETDLRSCHECGKIYKHPSCLYKHLWEHSDGWELTSKLPLTKHQQVQILEAATILVGMSTNPIYSTTTTTNSSSFSFASSPSSSSSLVDIQSVYRPSDDGVFIDIDDDDQFPNDDDQSDIISIIDDDDDPSSY